MRGSKWIREAKVLHDGLSDLVIDTAEVLKVDLDQIVEAVKRLPKPEDLKKRDERIQELEAERNLLQTRVNWAEGEMVAAKEKEKEALALVKNLTGAVNIKADIITKAALFDSKMISEGHITGTKVVTILVDFTARIERVFKEIQKLLAAIDPNHAMDFSTFPELPFVAGTPGKPVADQATRMEGLRGILTPAEPSASKIRMTELNLRPASEPEPESSAKSVPVPSKFSTPEVPKAQTMPNLMAGTFKVPGQQVRGDLINRIGGMTNPARTNPKGFVHMQETTPEKGSEPATLEDTTPEKEKEVQVIEDSDEESAHSTSGTEDDSDPSPATRHIQTRATAKTTPAKNTKGTPTSQAGSRSKKGRKPRH